MKRLKSRRLLWSSMALVAASFLPLTVSTKGGLRASSLCGSPTLSTCCRDKDSACSNVSDGVGWYDTGCVGRCNGEMVCPFPPPEGFFPG